MKYYLEIPFQDGGCMKRQDPRKTPPIRLHAFQFHWKVVLLTTDLMLAGEDFDLGVQRFFSQVTGALGVEVRLFVSRNITCACLHETFYPFSASRRAQFSSFRRSETLQLYDAELVRS